MTTHAQASAAETKPEPTTTVDLVIRLQVKGSPAEVARYREALEMLAEVMVVQAEDGLWSAGYADGGDEDDPNEFVADIEHTSIRAVLIEGTDTLVDDRERSLL